jgi:TPR repeat protein
MRYIVAALIAAGLVSGVQAGNQLEENTEKALAAGDTPTVIKALEREVYHGNIHAAEKLALIYRNGKGGTADPARARALLKMAAEPHLIRMWYKRGIASAQYELAVMYRDGMGGKANGAQAEYWFRQAADQGHAQAQIALARMYHKGIGIKSNPEYAFVWSSISASALIGAEQMEAQEIRALAEKQLQPKQLENARAMIKNWKPRSG